MCLVRFIISVYFRFILKRPHLTRRVLFYLPNLRTFYFTVINEIKYRLKSLKGYRVTCIVVELSTKCNMDCVICARHEVMTRPQSHMSMDTFKTLVDHNPGIDLYILVGWGEMMLNPNFFEAIDCLRQKGKKIALTTNAALLSEKNVDLVLKSGISHITLSIDGLDDVYESIRGVPFGKIEENIQRLAKKNREYGNPVYVEINAVGRPDVLGQAPEMFKRLGPYVDDIRFSSYLEYNKLQKTNRTRPCREFWRGMITVLFNGAVVPCCMDYNASMVIGHVNDGSLQLIWNNVRMMALRKEHVGLQFNRRCATCFEEAPPDTRINKRFE